MGPKTRESPTSVRLYLFTLNGEFLWSNYSSVTGEDEAILISGLIAAINKFASEFLGENLHKLVLNELNIHLFNILDQFFVAIILPNYIDQDLFRSNLLVNDILKLQTPALHNDLDERLPAVIAVLNELDKKLNLWLSDQSRISSELTYAFSKITNTLDEYELAFALYAPTGFRVYKYFSESSGINDLNYPIPTDNSLDIPLFEKLKGSTLIATNTVMYFNTIGNYISLFIKRVNDPLEYIKLNKFQEAYNKISKIILQSLKT